MSVLAECPACGSERIVVVATHPDNVPPYMTCEDCRAYPYVNAGQERNWYIWEFGTADGTVSDDDSNPA